MLTAERLMKKFNNNRVECSNDNYEECSSGSHDNSNNIIVKADRLAIDKLLSEHRSDIIKLGFMRQSRRMSSRLPTPLLAPPSNFNDQDPECLENINIHLPIDINPKVTNSEAEKIEKYRGIVSGETVLEISSFLDSRISEMKESKINEIFVSQYSKNTNVSDFILQSKFVDETKNEIMKNEISNI